MSRRARLAGVLLAALLVAGAPRSAVAGPWAAGRGHFYTKLTYSGLRTERFSTPEGKHVDIPEYRLDQGDFYGEIGLADRWTALLSVPYRSSGIEDFDDASGFGDLRFGVAWQLPGRGAWALAIRAAAQAPTGDPEKGGGLLATGSGAWEAFTTFSAGRSFAGGRGYGFGEVGHNFRAAGLRDSLVWQGQIGWHVGRLLVMGNVGGVHVYSDQPSAKAIGSPSGLGDGVEWLSFGPAASLDLGHGLALYGEWSDGTDGTNIALGSTARVGITIAR
jgi:hypothetical protein